MIAASNRSSRSATGSSFDGDATDGDRAGDDDDLVGAVGLVVGLPQRVRAPPAAYVGVDHGHEVDRLARAAAHLDEEVHVGRVQHGRWRPRGTPRRAWSTAAVGVGRASMASRSIGPEVVGVHAGQRAVEQLLEALAEGDVEPGLALVARSGPPRTASSR